MCVLAMCGVRCVVASTPHNHRHSLVVSVRHDNELLERLVKKAKSKKYLVVCVWFVCGVVRHWHIPPPQSHTDLCCGCGRVCSV